MTAIFPLISVFAIISLVVYIFNQKRLIAELKTVNSSHAKTYEYFKEELNLQRQQCNFLAAQESASNNELVLLKEELANLKSKQQSKSVRLGQLTENIIPLHCDFGVDYKTLVPMFRPVDYVAFEDEKITFIEIKMGTSQLSQKQRNIRRLIEEGKVYFKEVRVTETGVEVK